MARIRLKAPHGLLDQDNRWRVEEDLRTLQRAGEITSDSARLSTARALMLKQSKALEKIIKPVKPPTKRGR